MWIQHYPNPTRCDILKRALMRPSIVTSVVDSATSHSVEKPSYGQARLILLHSYL
jgi:hypothetical protein